MAAQSRRHPLAVTLVPLAIALAGCGDGVQLVPVTGTVTLDGLPLADATVVFRPEAGRPSAGTTDAEGRYVLRYTAEKAGALPGEHTVQIVTVAATDDADAPAREKLPARYNARTELRATVSAAGPTHDFGLVSK